jgi:TolB protein
MKKIHLQLTGILLLTFLFADATVRCQNESGVITIQPKITLGLTPPIPVSLTGFSGEVESVLKFDLYVQGFSFVAPDAAQYQISGSNGGNVVGRVADRFAKSTILSRSYTGADLREQAHAFANDIVQTITGKPGISLMRGSTARIAFKVEKSGGNGEIYVSDFDGHNPLAVTHDNAIVAAPAWVPGKLALYYTSYKVGNPDIFYHNLSTGQRRVIAGYSGLNTSAAVSPDGTKVAMILSRSGSPDVWVCDADGSNLKQLTHTPEDESSPCWSPDGRWICFATKIHERRVLAKIPAGGGGMERIPTPGTPNPTEPDWSPDGKWIAFTCQFSSEFDICVMPADGSAAPTILVRGQDPSWAPNSRTLVFDHAIGYRQVLSVLDVFTKQVKDVERVSGNDSEPAWAK